MLQNSIDLRAGKDHRYIERFFCSRNVVEYAEFPFQCMSIKKQQGIERLVLGRRRDTALDRQVSQIVFDIV